MSQQTLTPDPEQQNPRRVPCVTWLLLPPRALPLLLPSLVLKASSFTTLAGLRPRVEPLWKRPA
jgi:hypothetical protein